MDFEEGHLYHVYNRGINNRKLFYSRENYLFFLRKVRNHLLEYCDIVAYCLMPNHFHLMLYVKTSIVLVKSVNKEATKQRSLNYSIGILLRSYANAIQKQEKFTGSLFQQHTKALCLTKSERLTPAWFNTAFGTVINTSIPEKQYPQVCFNYIHENPVKSGLVASSEMWEISSAPDYAGIRNGTLINKKIAKDFGLIF
jgi:putative transposase